MTQFTLISNKTAPPPRRQTILFKTKIGIWNLDWGRAWYSSPLPDERCYLTTCHVVSFTIRCSGMLSPAHFFKVIMHLINHGRFQWPCSLRRVSAAARTLGLWVRISSGPWVECLFSRYRFLRRADPLSRGVLPCVCVSLSAIRRDNNYLHLQWVGRRGQTKK
jgi:hypothetical protein